ncbi:MAG: hypothetical protein ACRYGA_02405 [Janthinobacterium lividum]
MAHITANRIGELSATEGTGPLVLTPAVGMKRFSSAMNVGDTCWYLIESIDPVTGALTGAFEYGLGTYSALNTLSRAPTGSSNANALVSFTTGVKRVSLTILAPQTSTSEQWLSALGVTGSSENGLLALLLAVSVYARSETNLINNGGQ